MQSTGPLKTAGQVRRAADNAAAAASPDDARARDMVALARRNPDAFLARPSWQRDLIAASGEDTSIHEFGYSGVHNEDRAEDAIAAAREDHDQGCHGTPRTAWTPCYCGSAGWLTHQDANRNCPRNR